MNKVKSIARIILSVLLLAYQFLTCAIVSFVILIASSGVEHAVSRGTSLPEFSWVFPLWWLCSAGLILILGYSFWKKKPVWIALSVILSVIGLALGIFAMPFWIAL